MITPTAWSPGDQSWVETLNREWKDLHRPAPGYGGVPAASPAAPVGFAMFRPMAEALGWPSKPITWDILVDLVEDPQGWAKYGHPEWKQFKFGHTHPAISNSGLLILTDLAYSVLGNELTAELIKSDAFTGAIRAVELSHLALRPQQRQHYRAHGDARSCLPARHQRHRSRGAQSQPRRLRRTALSPGVCGAGGRHGLAGASLLRAGRRVVVG